MSDLENKVEYLEQKISFLIDTIHQLERRVNNLEKLLIDKNSSSESETSSVMGAMNIATIPKIKLSEGEIIEIYNNNSSSLINNAIKVSLTQESLTNRNLIVLEKTKSKTANYWILATEDDNYWLLPKANLRINTYTYATVSRIFSLDNYQSDYDGEFILTQLAKVALTPSGKQWKLLASGRLQFAYNNQTQSESGDSLNLETENSSEESTSDIYPEKEEEQTVTNDVEENNDLASLLVRIYNTVDKDSLLQLAHVVSETQENIFEMVFNRNKKLVFESNLKGKYWIFRSKQLEYYLVPKTDIEINQETIKILQYIFVLHDYQLEVSNFNKIKLLKPAKVIPLSSIDTEGNNWVLKSKKIERQWQLQEMGILQFIIT